MKRLLSIHPTLSPYQDSTSLSFRVVHNSKSWYENHNLLAFKRNMICKNITDVRRLFGITRLIFQKHQWVTWNKNKMILIPMLENQIFVCFDICGEKALKSIFRYLFHMGCILPCHLRFRGDSHQKHGFLSNMTFLWAQIFFEGFVGLFLEKNDATKKRSSFQFSFNQFMK